MFIIRPLGLLPVPPTVLSRRHPRGAFVTQLGFPRVARDNATLFGLLTTTATRGLWLPRRGHLHPRFVPLLMLLMFWSLLLLQMFPLLLLLVGQVTHPRPSNFVTVILKSPPVLLVTPVPFVPSMWACIAVAYVGGGFMRPALDGTLLLGLGVLPCSFRVHGIPTYVCHCHLDRRTPGIVLSAGSATSKLHGL